MGVPSEADWTEIAQGFASQCPFPNCLGAVDGKHVAITAPPNSGSLCFNCKVLSRIIGATTTSDTNWLPINGTYLDTASNAWEDRLSSAVTSPLARLQKEQHIQEVFRGHGTWPAENMPKLALLSMQDRQVFLSAPRRISVFQYPVVMAGRITAFLLMCAMLAYGIMAIPTNQDATARSNSGPTSAANEDARIDTAVIQSLAGGGLG
ncbi:uncharacterized protein [Dermacentor albipictus]|uniref:uncharacterized protein n=1 Tax=Dermacentor albipictus TaxID=60249 RepID=UPI0038FCA798